MADTKNVGSYFRKLLPGIMTTLECADLSIIGFYIIRIKRQPESMNDTRDSINLSYVQV